MKLRQWMMAIVSLVFAATVYAQSTPSTPIIEGQHYIVLPKEVRQQAVVQAFMAQDPGKIQVIEFFSYKCPGCYAMEAPFNAWAAKQSDKVAIRRVPISFGPTWEPIAKTYYVLEELGLTEKLTPVIFNAIHKDKMRLDTPSEIGALLAKNGVSLDTFNTTYNGFNVSRMWTQAQDLTKAEQVQSVPAMVVNGQYLTHLGMTKDPALTAQVLDYLVAKSAAGS